MIPEILQANPVALESKVKEAILNFKSQKIEKLKEEYTKLYPEVTKTEEKNVLGDVIAVKEEPIIYLNYAEVDSKNNPIYLEDKVTVKEVTYNVLDSEGNVNQEVTKLIKAKTILVKPILEKYLNDEIEELKVKELTNSDYNLTPVVIPTKTTEEEKAEIEKLNKFKEELKATILVVIQEVADLSYSKAEAFLAGKHNLSLQQVQRYKIKYNLAVKAKTGDSSANKALQLEATLSGMKVDDLVDLIIKLGTKWDTELNVFTTKIEAVRVAVQKVLETNPIKAIKIISKGAALKATVPDAEIEALFK